MSGHVILLADDDETMRDVALAHLERDGHTVIQAANGQEALDRFYETLPDLVLLDAIIPIVNGIEVTQRLRATPQGQDVPILLITATDDAQSVEAAYAAGVDDYVTKPLHFAVLRNRIRTTIDRYHAQRELHRTQALMDAMLDRAPIFLYAADLDGNLLINKGNAPAAFGLPADDVAEGVVYELFADKPILMQTIREALRGETSQRLFTLQDRTEAVMWHAPLMNAFNEIIGMFGVATLTNKTDWRDTALAATQGALQRLISNVPGMVTRSQHHPEWVLDFVSEGSTALTGYTPTELIGNREVRYIDLIHPDDIDKVLATVKKAIQSGDIFQTTYRITTKSGTEKWVFQQGQRVSADDEYQSVEGLMADITAQKRSEQILLGEQNLMRTLIDNLPDYIFVRDRVGRYLISNMANARYLGQSHPRNVIGKTDYDFFEDNRADMWVQDDQAVMNTRQPMLNHEVDVYYADTDERRWYSITKVPWLDSEDEVVGVVGMIRDITTRYEGQQKIRQANARLQELNDLKSHFLLTMSHELRTPLGVVLSYSDMLLSGIYGDLNEKQRDRIERIHENGEILLDQIQDILDISKIQTGKMEIDIQEVSLGPIIEIVLADYAEDAAQKALTLTAHTAPDLPAVRGDHDALGKIIDNLVSNALKFTEKGGVTLQADALSKDDLQEFPLTLEADQAQWVLISVEDSGRGIAAEMQQRIFEAFRQADNSATREHGGTGLGLALCRDLVGLMNGHIWLESTVGVGTAVYVLLPTASMS